MLVQQFLESSAKRSPDAVALVAGQRRLTYREQDVAANRLASAGPRKLAALAGGCGALSLLVGALWLTR